MGATHVNSIQPGAPGPSADIQSQKPFASFQPSNVPPSQAIYLQLNDVLFLQTIANSTVPVLALNYRYLTPQGEIKEGQLKFQHPGFLTDKFIPLGECWLLSLAVQFTTPGPNGCWAHVQVGICRNPTGAAAFIPQAMIWEGYVYNNVTNGWPGVPAKETQDGGGMPQAITGTLPAPGGDIFESPGSSRRWKLKSFFASLTTSATVANRFVSFAVSLSGGPFTTFGTATAQVASTTVKYNFIPGLTGGVDGAGNILIPAPPDFDFKSGGSMKTITTGLQAGDQWTAPIYENVEWGDYGT